ncbi:hypothetical protein [Leptospira interrogans]|uniref:hypothetical protein n=1 Tax=Leptospira interrogans TaxID=173 RepID=UPI000772FA60|nr:hypothetical protein [Leptospira interrogans]
MKLWLKIKTLRKIIDLKYTILRLRRQSSYRILGDSNKNTLIAVCFEHSFIPYAWHHRFFVLHVDHFNFKGETNNYLILEFGMFGVWFSIWIRLWKSKKEGDA